MQCLAPNFLPHQKPNPFATGGKRGSGVSTREWNEEHLDWLRVRFTENHLLYSCDDRTTEAGLLDQRLYPQPKSKLRSALEAGFGLAWDEIRDGRGLDAHYSSLRYLASLRDTNRSTCIATSSPFPSSQAPAQGQYATPLGASLRSSPPSLLADLVDDNMDNGRSQVYTRRSGTPCKKLSQLKSPKVQAFHSTSESISAPAITPLRNQCAPQLWASDATDSTY